MNFICESRTATLVYNSRTCRPVSNNANSLFVQRWPIMRSIISSSNAIPAADYSLHAAFTSPLAVIGISQKKNAATSIDWPSQMVHVQIMVGTVLRQEWELQLAPM